MEIKEHMNDPKKSM